MYMCMYLHMCVGASWYFLEWEHDVLPLFSSEEVEVVNRHCGAEQLQPCSSSSFRECHFSYFPEYWSQSGAPLPKASC